MALLRKNFTAKNYVPECAVRTTKLFWNDCNKFASCHQVFIIFINYPNFLEGVGYISNWGSPDFA